MIKRMHIVLTGGSGFVGKKLTNLLESNGYTITNLDLDLGYDISNWSTVSEIDGFDILIHLAARSYVPESYQRPREYYNTNVIGTLNALELCRINNAKMIFTSSYVYGIPSSIPINETHPLAAVNPYAETKLCGESLCKAYSRDFKIPSLILRPSNIYGPEQTGDFLIPTIIKQIESGTIHLKDARPKRDFIFIDDLVKAYLAIIQSSLGETEVFNIGSGESHSVMDVAQTINKLCGNSLKIEYADSDRKIEIMETRYDISKIKKLTGWYPETNLETGLKTILNIG